MRSRLTPGDIQHLERKFWICTGVITLVVLVLTVLDAFFLGFR
jgi:hypothetical protein